MEKEKTEGKMLRKNADKKKALKNIKLKEIMGGRGREKCLRSAAEARGGRRGTGEQEKKRKERNGETKGREWSKLREAAEV